VAAVSTIAALIGSAPVIGVAAAAMLDNVPGFVKPPFLQILEPVFQVYPEGQQCVPGLPLMVLVAGQ
jgi:hypothetical protein